MLNRHIIVFALTVAVLSLFYWQTLASIVAIWLRSDTFAHGFIILPISLYMIWVRRDSLKYISIKSSYSALAILFTCVIGWVFARAGNVLEVEQLALFSFFPALVATIYGYRMLMAVLFPVCYLVFAIPFGEELIPVLQDFTALFTVKALQLTGIPVFWEGRFLSIPSGNFEVAKACSGIRYLFASVALGCFYAYLTYNGIVKRIVFIIFSLILPILANGLRAYGIVIIAHLSDNKYATGVDHIIYGWVFFGLVMFILFWVGSFWRDEIVATTHSEKDASRLVCYKYPVIILSFALLAIGPASVAWVKYKSEQIAQVSSFVLPETIGKWQKDNDFPNDWQPEFQGADNKTVLSYRYQQQSVYVIVFSYINQSEDKELINYLNRTYDNNTWKLVSTRKRGDQNIPIIQERIRSNKRDLLVWKWYRIQDINLTNKIYAKFFEAYTKLFSKKPSYAFIIATPLDGNQKKEGELLSDFLRSFPVKQDNN